MKTFKSIIITIFGFLVLSIPLVSVNAYAACDTTTDPNCVYTSSLPTTSANSATLAVILNIVFAIIGSISVLIIVIAGLKFITSSGKPEEIAKAKDTIIYAAVGLVVCVSAISIVSFVAGYI